MRLFIICHLYIADFSGRLQIPSLCCLFQRLQRILFLQKATIQFYDGILISHLMELHHIISLCNRICVSSIPLSDMESQFSGLIRIFCLTYIFRSRIHTALVILTGSVIFVIDKRTFSGFGQRIYIQCKLIQRFLSHILHHRHFRKNCPFFYKYRKFVNGSIITNVPSSIRRLSIRIVIPGTLREIYLFCCGIFHHRSYQQTGTAHKLRIHMISVGILIILHNHGPCQRNTGSLRSISLQTGSDHAVRRTGVQIWNQLVPHIDLISGDLLASKIPRLFTCIVCILIAIFVAAGPVRIMETMHRCKGCQFYPALVHII